MKDLNKMNKQEKKDFLSMDLIERLIRLEQRVSASFGEFIKYTDTEYFKSLPEKKQQEFVRYLKNHKRRKFILGLFLLSLMVMGVIFRSVLTARAIEDNVNIPLNLIDIGILVFVFVFLLIIILSFISKNIRDKKIDGHFRVLHRLYLPELKNKFLK